MRILLLTQWFNPEPVFKGLSFAKELARRGYQVQVLTGFPNYPGGKIYPGYRVKFTQHELLDGISIIRVPLYPCHDSSSFRRALNYASFSLAATFIGVPQIKRPDVLFVYQPITIGLAAIAIKLAYRVPFMLDVQDLWPDFLLATGMVTNHLALKLVNGWCNFIYKQARRITVLSPGCKRALVERGVPESKVDVAFNWCDEEQVNRSAQPDSNMARSLGLSGRFNILFAGTMGKAQGLDSVLDAAALVQPREPQVQFVFCGGGVDADRLKLKASALRLANVIFLPRRPLSEIGQLISLADVLFIHLKDDPIFEKTIPSKTQTYLAMGKPILIGARGDAVNMVLQSGAGISCVPQSPESIADAAITLFRTPASRLAQMGECGRTFYERELSLKSGVNRYITIFEQMIEEKKKKKT